MAEKKGAPNGGEKRSADEGSLDDDERSLKRQKRDDDEARQYDGRLESRSRTEVYNVDLVIKLSDIHDRGPAPHSSCSGKWRINDTVTVKWDFRTAVDVRDGLVDLLRHGTLYIDPWWCVRPYGEGNHETSVRIRDPEQPFSCRLDTNTFSGYVVDNECQLFLQVKVEYLDEIDRGVFARRLAVSANFNAELPSMQLQFRSGPPTTYSRAVLEAVAPAFVLMAKSPLSQHRDAALGCFDLHEIDRDVFDCWLESMISGLVPRDLVDWTDDRRAQLKSLYDRFGLDMPHVESILRRWFPEPSSPVLSTAPAAAAAAAVQ